MQFAPKLAYPCEQSVLPGDSRSNSGVSLALSLGDCVTSPNPFQSFVAWSSGTVGPRYVLQTYSEASCHGTIQNLSLGTGDFVDGACKFMQGRSVKLTFNASYANMSDNQGKLPCLWPLDTLTDLPELLMLTSTLCATNPLQVTTPRRRFILVQQSHRRMLLMALY